MRRSSTRLLILAVGVILFLIASALLYQAGMGHLEHKPRTFWDAFEWAAETLSTTGYGADSRWTHPVMVLFVSFVQLAGVFVIFLIVPVFLVPFLEERFEQRLPRRAPNLRDHVIVYRYGPAVETLLQRLAAANVPTLVVDTDETAARQVMERGQAVVFSRTEEDALDVSRLMDARALVANGRDEENAAVTLRARQMGFTGEIYAFVQEPAHRKPMELAGATSAYTPRHIIAAALAAHASERISPRLPGLDAGSAIVRREIRISARSPIAGKTLAEVNFGARSGAIVIGQWMRSTLVARCSATTIIEPGAIIEVVGTLDAIDRAVQLSEGTLLRHEGAFVVAGFGEVGRKMHELLTDAGERVIVIERIAAPGVDVVASILDSSVLRDAVANARTLLLALDSDDSTLFASVIARDACPDLSVVARVNHARNLVNIHSAGADYALSISDVSGAMLSSRLLGASRIREEHHRVATITIQPGDAFANRTLADLQLRARHGCSVLGIERNGALMTAMSGATSIEPGDRLFVCGSSHALAQLKS
jgi:Trk K+ transport system NAD-binding subunit